jgi:predicted nucleotide-binding protein (sugar kinase/HSP70/actin superfamily)
VRIAKVCPSYFWRNEVGEEDTLRFAQTTFFSFTQDFNFALPGKSKNDKNKKKNLPSVRIPCLNKFRKRLLLFFSQVESYELEDNKKIKQSENYTVNLKVTNMGCSWNGSGSGGQISWDQNP